MRKGLIKPRKNNKQRKTNKNLPKYEIGTPPSGADDLKFNFDPGVILDIEVKGNDEQSGNTMIGMLQEKLQPKKPVALPTKPVEQPVVKPQTPVAPPVINGRNNIPEQFEGVYDKNAQKYVDLAKLDLYPLLVDDYYYRAKKYNPQVTKEQVSDVYNNTPFLAGRSARAAGSARGYYASQDREGTRDYSGGFVRVMPDKWTKYNANNDDVSYGTKTIPYDQIMTHEAGHMYDDYLYGSTNRRNEQEDAILEDAYRGVFGNDLGIEEIRQINRELRGKIHAKNNRAIEQKLTDAIKNTKDSDIQWMMDAESNGYINKTNANAYFNQLKKDGKLKQLMDKIRKAMIEVAYNNNNPYQRRYTPTQLHIPNMNYEMA